MNGGEFDEYLSCYELLRKDHILWSSYSTRDIDAGVMGLRGVMHV
jgi:hypothetical protein